MSDSWEQFAVYPDAASAEVVAGLLRSESVPVRLVPDEPVPGLVQAVRLMIPAGAAYRAGQALAQARLSEEELAALAISTPPDENL